MPDTDQPLCEAISYEQVQQVIHAFYEKLMAHPQLGHFFAGIDDFSHHEQRIVDFWWISMGGKADISPRIDMIGKHFPLGIQAADLETWLALFSETLGEQLDEALAVRWMDKTLQIAARLKQIIIDHQPMGIQLPDPK
jgi:hemoglobin